MNSLPFVDTAGERLRLENKVASPSINGASPHTSERHHGVTLKAVDSRNACTWYHGD